MPYVKRPLLMPEDRARLRKMAEKAKMHGETGHNRSYCKGVEDVLMWLNGEEMTPMLKDLIR